tara:strand:+ start:1869 stop:2153 length:285 start_codon:yes stop_codon:yes gene_type:complete
MAKITLTIETSTVTKNKNFANKLVGKGNIVKTAFGDVEGGKRTFYMFTDQENAKGTAGEVELNNFDQVKRDYPFVDEVGKEQVATLTYLYPKKA